MDIQKRKIEFIQEFLKVQNEELLIRLENLLHSKESTNEDNFSPMTIDEFSERIKKSLHDAKNDRITESIDLVSEIEKWG